MAKWISLTPAGQNTVAAISNTAKNLSNSYKAAKNDTNVKAATQNVYHYDPIYHTAVGNAKVTTAKKVEQLANEVSAITGSNKSSSSGSGGGSGGGSVIASTSDPYQKIYDLIKETSQANNEWSAAPAIPEAD